MVIIVPNILEVMSFRISTRVAKKLCPDPQGKWIAATYVVYCILTQILCVVSQKKLQLLRPPDALPGLCPWTPLGDFRPQTSSLLLSPNNPVRSTPLPVRRATTYGIITRCFHEFPAHVNCHRPL